MDDIAMPSIVRWLLRTVVAVVVMLSLTGFPWSSRAENARWGKRPAQFYQALETVPNLGSGKILSVAHNAGDGAQSSDLAVAHGADIVEIDLIVLNGRLYAAHDMPPDWLPTQIYRGPTLRQAWDLASRARFIKFDLKESSPATLRKLVAFLDDHQDGRRVFVAARDPRALATLATARPDLVRLLSIGSQSALDQVMSDPAQVDLLNGVTVRATLLDGETVAWFKAHGLLVFAWTVNNEGQLIELVASGVDAITTDNLAILDAISQAQQRRDEIDLSRLVPE